MTSQLPTGWKPAGCTCTIAAPNTSREMRVLDRTCPVHAIPEPDPAGPRWTPPRQINPTPATDASLAVAQLHRTTEEQIKSGYTAGGVLGLLDQTVMVQIATAALLTSNDEDLGQVVRSLIDAADDITCTLLADSLAEPQ